MCGVDIQSHFGTAVQTRRKRLGISQEELAGRAGLHRTYVADIERGARNLSLASIDKLARALETSIPTLFSQAVAAPPRQEATSEAVDILLVEDSPEDVQLTLREFKRAGLTNRVHVVHDGAEALDFVFCTGAYAARKVEDRPQVILLDLCLPKVSGLEVLRRLKSDERTRTIPVAVLTASQRDRDVMESRRLGAETYIVKPVDFHRFSQVTPQLKFCWLLLQSRATPLV